MIFIAWLLAVLFSLPQAYNFSLVEEGLCQAKFAPGWGEKVSVISITCISSTTAAVLRPKVAV